MARSILRILCVRFTQTHARRTDTNFLSFSVATPAELIGHEKFAHTLSMA